MKRGDVLWVLTFKDLMARRQIELRQESGDRWTARPAMI
jgi:hypothetical protein